MAIFDDAVVIFDATGVIFDAANASVLPPLKASAVTLFAPTVPAPGAISVQAPLIASNRVLFAPAVPGVAPTVVPLGSTAIYITPAPPVSKSASIGLGVPFIDALARAMAPKLLQGSPAQRVRQTREDEEMRFLSSLTLA